MVNSEQHNLAFAALGQVPDPDDAADLAGARAAAVDGAR